MTELCSEIENMNLANEHFSFLKDIYNDFAKYTKQYKSIASEYSKKMGQLQEKYSFPLIDVYKSKKKYSNINTNLICSITSIIPKVIKQLIENIDYLTHGIESTIITLENIIKEKNNLALKYQSQYDESRTNLFKNYKAIDKCKGLFMHSMANCEDIIQKYYNYKSKCLLKILANEEKKDKEKEKIESKIKKIKNTFDPKAITEEQMSYSISDSKRLEIQYKGSFESTEKLEKKFTECAEDSAEKMKKISCELTIKLKDIILDFVVLLKNSLKMPLSEIDTLLPKLSDSDFASKCENIMKESSSNNKQLPQAKPSKYKLKCLCIPRTIDGKFNHNNHIIRTEDGFEELTFIDDKITFLTIKEMSKYFDLLDIQNMDLKEEEEKLIVKELTSKLLSFENKPKNENSNILLSEKEINVLNNLLDTHYNRVLFLQSLSNYRSNGKYCFPADLFDLIYKYFKTIIDTILRDKDFHCGKNIIILSQTYYLLEDGKKKYLQEKIEKDELFQNFNFWKEYLEFSIDKEIIRTIKSDTKNDTLIKDSQKESDEMYANIVFSQLVPISDNMIEFGLNRKMIKEIIKPIIKHYNISENSIAIIDDVIHKNSIHHQRKSMLLNEEIKLLDYNYSHNNNNNNNNNSDNKNYENISNDKDENICDRISVKNDTAKYNFNNLSENEINDNKININSVNIINEQKEMIENGEVADIVNKNDSNDKVNKDINVK